MKVKELIEFLKEFPQDHDVIMSSDAEGNSFSPLADFYEAVYVAESTWSGRVVSPEDSEDEETRAMKENSVVICPVN